MRRRRKNKRNIKIFIGLTICLLLIMTVGYAAFRTNINITAKGNIIDKSRVIQSWENISNEDFHTDYYKENIVTATFLDTNEIASNAIESWDVSEAKDKGVMAWVVPTTEDSTKYDLYIGANKGVIANEDSGFLFSNFTGLKYVHFGNNFDTENVRIMYFMFSGCNNLNQLDLSSFVTNNVVDMHCMFQYCNNLVELDLSNFNTESVTRMDYMFFRDFNLSSLDISNFNTSNVTNMEGMFSECTNLLELNLCSFDTNKVTSMRWMFNQSWNITNIFVGDNWTTANTDITAMFDGSAISSATTGQCS